MPLEWRSAVNLADAAFGGRKAVRVRRVLLPLGILAMLSACGPPASDARLTKENAKADSAPKPPPRPLFVTQTEPAIHRGVYRRLGVDSRFRPCNAPEPLEIIGNGNALAKLREEFRWNSFWQGKNMFAVFEGMIVTDSVVPEGAPADSATPTLRTRFYILQVDSLRTWEAGDCKGMRVP